MTIIDDIRQTNQMTNRELKLKLKNLQAVQPAVLPNALWMSETRRLVLAHAKETSAVPVQGQLIAPVVLPQTMFSRFMFAMRPVVATVMVAGFAVVGWAAGVSSSMGNKPGDLLYGLKSAAEKTQLTFAADPSSRAYLHLELAGRRANELAVLAEGTSVNRENDLMAAMSALQNEIVSVKQNLDEVNTAKSSDTAAVAKAVDRKVAEINAVFDKTKNLLSANVQAKANVVVAAADDVSLKAVAVLVEAAKTSEDKTDAAARVKEKIDSAEKDMQVASTEAGDQAKEALKQAKAALASDHLSEALTKVQESADITNAVVTTNDEKTITNTNAPAVKANMGGNNNLNTGKIKAIDF